jgi:large repetitive protein
MLELRKLWTRVGSLNYRLWAFWMLASLWTATPLQAQIGGGGQVSCNTGVSVTPTLRGEGYTELAGEIHFTCSGGSALPVGSALPLLNFTVFLNTAVTSRLLPVANGDNISEALLILDEPGSGPG